MLKRAGWSEGGGLGDVGKLKFCYISKILKF